MCDVDAARERVEPLVMVRVDLSVAVRAASTIFPEEATLASRLVDL